MYIVSPFSLEEIAVAVEGEKMCPLHGRHQIQESVTHLRGLKGGIRCLWEWVGLFKIK